VVGDAIRRLPRRWARALLVLIRGAARRHAPLLEVRAVATMRGELGAACALLASGSFRDTAVAAGHRRPEN